MTEQPKRVLDTVREITNTRRNGYASPILNFVRIAIHWTDYLRNKGKLAKNSILDPEDVGFMMLLLKVAREENTFQEDNLADGMGYLDCIDSINQDMIRLGYDPGIEAFRYMNFRELLDLRDTLLKERKEITNEDIFTPHR